MNNNDKAKLKLLKMSKDYEFLVFDEIAKVCSEYGVENIDPLIAFLEQQDVKIYESLEAAEDNDEIVIWDDLNDRLAGLKKLLIKQAKNNSNSIYIDNIFELADEYELELTDEQIDEIASFLTDNSINIISDDSDNKSSEKEKDNTDYKIFVLPYYLKSLCESEVTFERGMEYYSDFSQRVKNFSLVGNTLYAEVVGRKTYNVSVVFKYGRIYEHTCNCEAHNNYKGPCKHIVAAILELNSRNRYISSSDPNVVKQVEYIQKDYEYSTSDLDKISKICFEAIEEDYFENNYLEDYNVYCIAKASSSFETSDPNFFKGERMKFVLEKCYSLAKAKGIEIQESVDEPAFVLDEPEEYYEDDDFSEEDQEIDSGYRNDFDYSED